MFSLFSSLSILRNLVKTECRIVLNCKVSILLTVKLLYSQSLTMIEELEIRLEAIARGEVFDDEPKEKKENPSLDHKIKTINRGKSPGRTVVTQQVVTTKTRTKSPGRVATLSSGDRGRSPARPSASGPPNIHRGKSKSPGRPSVSN